MLAAGLIAKCAISLISTLKQTPRQAGEELFARSYILWHRILFWERGGGVVGGWGGEGGSYPCFLSPFSLCTFFFLFSSTYHIIFRCGRANSGACSFHTALLTHFSNAGGAAMIGGICLCSSPRWCYSLIRGLVNSVDLFSPTVSVILPILLHNSWNTCIFGLYKALLTHSNISERRSPIVLNSEWSQWKVTLFSCSVLLIYSFVFLLSLQEVEKIINS